MQGIKRCGAWWLALLAACVAQVGCTEKPKAEYVPLVQQEAPRAEQTLSVTFRNRCANEVHIVVGPKKGPAPEPSPGLEQILVPGRSEKQLTAQLDWLVWHLGDNGGWAAAHLGDRPEIVQIPETCVGIEPLFDDSTADAVR
jgi:hypothetical protein